MGEAGQKYRVRNANERDRVRGGGRRREGVERCPLSSLVSRVNGKSIIRIRGQSAKKYTRCYNFKRNAALKFFNDRRCTHSSTLFTTQSDYIPTLFSTRQILFPPSPHRLKNLLLDDSRVPRPIRFFPSFNPNARNVKKRNVFELTGIWTIRFYSRKFDTKLLNVEKKIFIIFICWKLGRIFF